MDEDEDDDNEGSKRAHPDSHPTVTYIPALTTTRQYEDEDVPQYVDQFPLPAQSTFSLHPVVYDAAHQCCATVPEYGVHRGTTFSSTLNLYHLDTLCLTYR